VSPRRPPNPPKPSDLLPICFLFLSTSCFSCGEHSVDLDGRGCTGQEFGHRVDGLFDEPLSGDVLIDANSGDMIESFYWDS
jgi:hypothetical protein